MKRKKPVPKRDKLRKPGEHWYEVTDLFDPNRIQSLGGQMFVMGKLDDVVIVEVPDHVSPKALEKVHKQLRAMGVTSLCFAIQAGVRFLKLKALTAVEETALEAEVARKAKEVPDGAQADHSGP